MTEIGKERLADLVVVVVDCQTTGPTPLKGQLLELAWSQVRAGRDSEGQLQSRLVALPEGESLPRQVARITGISETELEGALDEERVAADFIADLKSLVQDELIVVAHYARFEQRFISHLLEGADSPALRYVCTYELARRLMPDLPKHTLRAVAGHIGVQLGESRRAADHVEGTAAIWGALVSALEREEGVETVEDLAVFLDAAPAKRPKKKRTLVPKEQVTALPTTPGVYRFIDVNDKELYVGKATRLKERVSSYFTHAAGKAGHILEMLACARGIVYEETETALEAALRESDLIKELDPPYNRSLRVESTDLHYVERTGEARLGPFPTESAASALKSLDGIVSLERLLAFGALLNHRDVPVDEADEEEQEDQEDDWREPVEEWSEAQVLRFLIGTVAASARHFYRGTWYGLLGEATVTWTKADGALRQLALSECRVVDVRNVSDSTDGDARAESKSKGPVNRSDYDRMRVLTTEIRRLIGAGRDVAVTVSTDRIGGDRLAELLRGV